MGQISVELNGKPYTVGCEDGQEAHLMQLAKRFDEQVRSVAGSVGQLGDTRLFLMAGLVMADDIADLQSQLAHVRAELTHYRNGRAGLEDRAAEVLDAAAQRIEALANRVAQTAG